MTATKTADRLAFESWILGDPLTSRTIERNSKGEYISMQTSISWEAWSACCRYRDAGGIEQKCFESYQIMFEQEKKRD